MVASHRDAWFGKNFKDFRFKVGYKFRIINKATRFYKDCLKECFTGRKATKMN